MGKSANAYQQDIQQVGLVVGWEIANNWAVVGRYYQDLALQKPVEQYLGVQYNSCCWAASVGVNAMSQTTKTKHVMKLFMIIALA